jgi:hypothetical protein
MQLASKACARLGIKPGPRLLHVRIGAATLQLYRGEQLVRAYPVSTSRRPPSNVRDSLGTPRGWHVIAERIGAGQPAGMVFRARVPTGRHWSELPPGPDGQAPDLVTSRILWLRGLESGVNLGGDVDTYSRYVYIHGTNHGDRIGEPLSAGCVLLRDVEMIELFDEVRAGDLVWITD